MTLVNASKVEHQVEIQLHSSTLFGKKCYSFICHNLNAKTKIQHLKNINKMRQVMVGSISHELRTPLNGLMILLSCAESSPNISEAFYDKYLKPSLQCADYLLNLINDILDYTQMNFNKELRLVFEPVDIRELIDGINELLKMKIRLKKLEMITEIAEDVPRVFMTDPRRLK